MSVINGSVINGRLTSVENGGIGGNPLITHELMHQKLKCRHGSYETKIVIK